MAKEKKLLGPDGKPLDVAKYRPAPPKPKRADGGTLTSFTQYFKLGFDAAIGQETYILTQGTPSPSQRTTLAAAIERDVIAATAEADGFHGHAELPPPPPELMDRYDVAFAEAARQCRHENSVCTSYANNERRCEDCGRYFHRKSSLFGW